MAERNRINRTRALLTLDDVSLRHGERVVFRHTRWTWHRGEQWAILGPNGAGKSLLASVLDGTAIVCQGEIHCDFAAGPGTGLAEVFLDKAVALLSPLVQRDLVTREGSFYQSRWHSGFGEGHGTVAEFLSPASVAAINPFEVGARRGQTRLFRQQRRWCIRWLGLENLQRRKLLWLSNGEQRKVLLAHMLLRSPRLLILDDPFGGLDSATRFRLKQVVQRLRRAGLPVLIVTSRPDEILSDTTHALLVQDYRVIAQGKKNGVLQHPLVRTLKQNSKVPARATGAGARPRRPRLAAGRPLIELNRVTVQLGRERVLDAVTWTMHPGEHWALLGPNGSGKTTLLSLIQGDNPQAYAVDIRLFGVQPQSTRTFWQNRQRLGWVSPELHLHYPPGWSCQDVVCSGFTNTVGLYQAGTRRQKAAARTWLREVGLEEKADAFLGELSLGDQRLVLLARAMVNQPRLLILDEPCQGLDAAHRRQVLGEVDRLVQRTRAGLIYVTHHHREMPACITHVLRLQHGRVASAGRKKGGKRTAESGKGGRTAAS